jgi:hypothetical protein
VSIIIDRTGKVHVEGTLVRHKSRGYYLDPATGEKLRSVTTILTQGVPKEALIYWAGNLTAETAMANLPMLVRASKGTAAERAEVYDWLRRAPTRKKEERGDIGGALHDLIEAKILGAPIPLALIEDPEMVPYIEWFEEFVADWQITFEASEMVVANYEHGYAGTLDYMFWSPLVKGGKLLMGDTKSGGELDIKGVYSEAGLQMAAYRHAEVGWLRDGARVPMPQTHGGYVLHLRPEGYRLVPLESGDDMFAEFLNARAMAHFTSVVSKKVVGKPMHPGDGHVLRADGTCRHCPHSAPVPTPKPVAPSNQMSMADGLCLECSDGEYDDPTCGNCGAGIDNAPLAVEGAV